MQSRIHGLLPVPASQFLYRYKPIGRVHIDIGEKRGQSFGDIKPVLIVYELLPLWVGIGGIGLGRAEGMVLPFLVLTAELDVGDERVEGGVVVLLLTVEWLIEGEVGAEAEAAVARGDAS